MLLEDAKDLSARIAQFKRLQVTADEAKQFETRAKQFSAASEKLVRARAALQRMKAAGVDVSFVSKEGDALAQKAATLRSAVRANPNALADPPFDLKYAFTDRLLGIGAAADEAMLAAWRAFVRENSNSGSDDVIEALWAVPQYRPTLTKIRSFRSQLAALANVIPDDPGVGVAQLRRIVDDHHAAWTEMTAEGIPDPVIPFLRACAADGAPLSELTNEVRSWLESRNLLHAFRIKIR